MDLTRAEMLCNAVVPSVRAPSHGAPLEVDARPVEVAPLILVHFGRGAYRA